MKYTFIEYPLHPVYVHGTESGFMPPMPKKLCVIWWNGSDMTPDDEAGFSTYETLPFPVGITNDGDGVYYPNRHD